MQNWFVVVMGLVTVFVVLILIIGLCWLLGLACRGSSKKEEMQAAAAAHLRSHLGNIIRCSDMLDTHEAFT